MAFEDDLITAGAKKIMKKKFFVPLDDILGNPTEDDIERVEFTDINDDPIHSHVWVPPGKSFRCYNEASETTIKRKIKNKENPDIEIKATEKVRISDLIMSTKEFRELQRRKK